MKIWPWLSHPLVYFGLVLLLSSPASPAIAGELSVTLNAGSYDLVDLPDGQHEIHMEEFGQLRVPGAPQLPARTFLVAIPATAVVRDVKFLAVGETELPGAYAIPPAPVVAPLSSRPDIDAACVAEWERNYAATYTAGTSYPPAAGRYEGTGALRKYRFVRVAFFPFAYATKSGKLTYRSGLTVTIEYDQGPASPDQDVALRDAGAETAARRLIVNHEQARRWYAPRGTPAAASETFDYIIITTDALAVAVGSLVDWKTSIGYRVNVITTTWIASNYSGRDLQEQIRNFLIDNYLEWGIEYVLIVGDIDVVPMRQCYPDTLNHGDDQLFCPPTDYYYADLTGDWDADGDGWFGEYGQDSVDFIPEVYVGRIPWSDVQSVADICDKSVTCEADTGAWKSRALLVGTHANLENQDHTGLPVMDFAVLMEKMINDMLGTWTYTTMYEVEGLAPSVYACDLPVSASNFLNEWAEGPYGLVNWAGHGSTQGAARLVWDRDDGNGIPEFSAGELYTPFFIHRGWVPNLNNAHPSISFHLSCNNAWPEEENLARELLRTGAVGTLASTRAAWYAKGWDHETDGLVATLNYFFMYHLATNREKVGEALYNSNAYYATRFVFDHYREWQNLFDYVLYGDPALIREGVPVTCSDSDGDGAADPGQLEAICGASDNCADLPNADQADFDGDGYGDLCDHCPGLPADGNPVMVPGDVNGNSAVNSADVIYLVNCAFKGGPEPLPVAMCGDTDCSGALTSGDIIWLVNFVFKSGEPPCDVCALP